MCACVCVCVSKLCSPLLHCGASGELLGAEPACQWSHPAAAAAGAAWCCYGADSSSKREPPHPLLWRCIAEMATHISQQSSLWKIQLWLQEVPFPGRTAGLLFLCLHSFSRQILDQSDVLAGDFLSARWAKGCSLLSGKKSNSGYVAASCLHVLCNLAVNLERNTVPLYQICSWPC